jgi:hypothetical protein
MNLVPLAAVIILSAGAVTAGAGTAGAGTAGAGTAGANADPGRVGEIFVVDRDSKSVIVSGAELETVPEGEVLLVRDGRGREIARVRVVKNSAATLKAEFVSGRFSLIREKMDVCVEMDSMPAATATNGPPVPQGPPVLQGPQDSPRMVDPVQVKILDDGQQQDSGDAGPAEDARPEDPKLAEYNRKKLSVLRLGAAEFSGLCLPGSGLAHYLVKDFKGGLLVNALAGSGLALYVLNEVGVEYWYRKNSAVFYSTARYASMAVFAAAYLYDLIDAPIKWSRYNSGLRQRMGISALPQADRGFSLSFTLVY